MSTMGKWTKIPEHIPNSGRFIFNDNDPVYFFFPKFQWWFLPFYVPYILVPQDGYKFVAAMDEMIRQLPVEEPKHKGWQN
jgi:hypothetical protein